MKHQRWADACPGDMEGRPALIGRDNGSGVVPDMDTSVVMGEDARRRVVLHALEVAVAIDIMWIVRVCGPHCAFR